MKHNLAVAVVGAGKWGQNLIRTFAQLGVLKAIVDPDVVTCQALAATYNVAYFTHIDDVLVQDIDAVAIATPVFTHYQLAKKVLQAKKDVFVEKPMTTTVEEAEDLLQLAKIENRIIMVGHLLLYQPAIGFIKNFIDEGKLGDVFSYRQIRRSLGTIRQEENVLYSLGVHDLAVLDYLSGESVKRIIASSQHVMSNSIADEVNVHLQYFSGKQAHLHLNWLWPIKDRQLMVLGEKGALHFDEVRQDVIYYKNYGQRDATLVQGGSELVFEDKTAPLLLELEHFLDCIVHRRQPRSCGLQGRNVVDLMSKIMAADRVHHHEQELLHT